MITSKNAPDLKTWSSKQADVHFLKKKSPVFSLDNIFIMPLDQISYSEKYLDETFEYRSGKVCIPEPDYQYHILITNQIRRHVILPPDIAKLVPKNHLMSETEWRNLGIQQSPGWIHYMVHAPEPHVLLFRRPVPNPQRQPVKTLPQHTISHGQ